MSIRQTLLQTPADRVPAALAASVKAFSEPVDVIRSAFVGLVEITRDAGEPEEHLAVAFGLVETSLGTEEGDRELRIVADRFYDTMPEEVQAGGCNFLEAGGIAAWQEKAQQVFAR